MDKAKPIEPGCLAVIIPDGHSDFIAAYAWQQVVIIEKTYAPKGQPRQDQQWWKVDDGGKDYLWANEGALLRIDDPDLQKQIENERELVHG